jgi:hypothetical protein
VQTIERGLGRKARPFDFRTESSDRLCNQEIVCGVEILPGQT